ncbi:MAG TPA: hypothetical protein EYQ74_09860 [Planctomycetes bacterium]|nr:hypothetical protein [Planctomycetota bacterium]HIK60789.1 hypothetical protein [Planctomycetota bacterium]
MALLTVAQLGLVQGQASALWGLLLLLAPYVVGRLSRRSMLAGHFRRASLLGRLLGLWSVVGFGVFVLGTNWIALLRQWSGSSLDPESWPELTLIPAFAPFVILQVLCIDAEARVNTRPGVGRSAARGLALRMFLSTVTPLAVYLGVLGVVGAVPLARTLVEEVDLYHALFLTLLLVGMSLGVPHLIANAWRTRPLEPGPTSEILGRVAERAGFTCREVRVWDTGNLIANAAIVGVGRRRLVLLSDALLQTLGPRELASVYGHEIGHAKCRHVSIFLAWSLGFFLAADLLAPASELWGSVFLAGALGTWILCFGWLSRRSELEADLYSLNLLGDSEALASALGQVGQRMSDRGGWRHFSASIRMGFLASVSTDPEVGRRFKRRMRVGAWLGAGLLAVTGALELRQMGEAYGPQRTRADLALGRYPAAIARAAKLDGEWSELRALTQLVASLAERGPVGEEQLERALTEDLNRKEWVRAGGWAALLALRGSAPATDFLRLMELVDEGAGGGREAESLEARLPPSWKVPH